MDVVEVELMKSNIETLSNKEDIISKEQITSKDTVSSMAYFVPQISSVESLSMIKKRNDNDMEHETNVKERRKKKKSQEANSRQNKEECMESSIKEFLTNFCGSNATEGVQNLCTDKCIRAASTAKGDEKNGNKLVPPLRLKKVVHTGNNK